MGFNLGAKLKVLGGDSKKKEELFWIWFQKNSKMLFNFEADQKKIFDILAEELAKIHSHLTFEFGAVINDKREFTISANGIKAAFPNVESLYNSAPELRNWNFKKFRQRRQFLSNINLGNKSIAAKDVNYKLVNNKNKIGIVLFFDDYTDTERNIYAQIGYLMLDEALGEYDVETKVGGISFQSRISEDFINSNSLNELAEDFDKHNLMLNTLH